MQKACGGVGDVKKADAKIQGIVDNVILLKLTSYLKKSYFTKYLLVESSSLTEMRKKLSKIDCY